ncbi:MAG: hypothetical protein Q8876_09800, partial [Bacillota bacterium]|nr:hypothetical protein [Bacillota bacterium]
FSTGIFTTASDLTSVSTSNVACGYFLNQLTNLTTKMQFMPTELISPSYSVKMRKLSSTTFILNAAGTDITSYTNSGTVDVSKFHFELVPNPSINFTSLNIPVGSRFEIISFGRACTRGYSFSAGFNSNLNFLTSGYNGTEAYGAVFGYSADGICGEYFSFDAICTIDLNGIISVISNCGYNTWSSPTSAASSKSYIYYSQSESLFTSGISSIQMFNQSYFRGANGTRVLLYQYT